MTEGTVVPRRPETPIDGKGGSAKPREPWELQERLGRNKLIEKIMDEFSGFGGNTTAEMRHYYSLVKAMRDEGYECDAEVAMLEGDMRISGDEQGKNKTQLIQVVEEKPIMFPGAAGLYPPVEPVPGLLARAFNFVTGKDGGKK